MIAFVRDTSLSGTIISTSLADIHGSSRLRDDYTPASYHDGLA